MVVGDSVKGEIKQVFNTGKIPEYLNRTLITIIPKCSSSESINNYYPIGLCNTVYNVITKLIVARIRSTLSYLISPLQIAFVPKWMGVDNVIIVQELIHSMSKKKGREGCMAIKIDLEKAYDRLEWSFIRDTLSLYKFSSHLISLIMSCVSSSTVSVFFNRGALDHFQPFRGIRQGDPLSPYLFILCMEVLRALIKDKCRKKLWNPIKASQGGPAFSHLFFAYDLMSFAKVDRKNCVAIKEVLESFSELSWQKISSEKCCVFFSPNVDQTIKEDLCEILGFKPISSLGKYLGFPIKHKGSQQDFGFILD